jgi:basic membrane lipoprotein Med (substrate-binding protein (PBP1-ABC) superfamily)
VSEALAGRCQGGLYVGGIKEGNIKLAPLSPQIPKDVAALIDGRTKDIADGRIKVFNGPIKDNKGIVRAAAGVSLTDADLGKMDWFAEGISVGQ